MSLSNLDAQHASDAHCRLTTRAVRAGIDRDTAFGAVTPPLVLSSNFSFAGFYEKRQYDYTRSGNPTRDLLADALAELESGAGGVVTSTGMAAITLVLNTLLQPGDRLATPLRSEVVADRHAAWLAAGIHVASACKLGQGGSLARWREIQSARARGVAQRASPRGRRWHRQPRGNLVRPLSRAALADPGTRCRRRGHGGGVAGRCTGNPGRRLSRRG